MPKLNPKALSFEQVCSRIDWKKLREQKNTLYSLHAGENWAEGLLALLDCIQDSAVDYYGKSEKLVFGGRDLE